MIYTDSGKYAIRAVTHMAGRENLEEPVSAAEIAAAEGIPPFYMAKVLQDLARADILDSLRGRGGGFVLRGPPKKLRVLDVLDAVEDIRRLTKECILGLDDCTDDAPCPLHVTWKRFRESLLGRLERLTVADLATELARKRKTLGKRKR